MWLRLRKTARRGRLGVPVRRSRTRRWRRTRAARGKRDFFMGACLVGGLAGLPGLAAHVFASVANAFALVRLGRADLANVGRDLPDLLPVDALDRDPGGTFDLELNAGGRRHVYGM